MRAPKIIIAAVASLGLADCAGVRTINGFETTSTKHFCELQVFTCVILAAGVIGAGVGIAVSASGNSRNPADAAAVLSIISAPPNPPGAANTATAVRASAAVPP